LPGWIEGAVMDMPVALIVVGSLAIKGIVMFVIAYAGARLAIKHERFPN
jgi:hypothetical protein